jgi:hypothetical protein
VRRAEAPAPRVGRRAREGSRGYDHGRVGVAQVIE